MYKRAFPDYDGELYCPDGFEDYSYKNDVCPCVGKRIGDDGEILIRIWQDYVDRNKREYENEPRFMFQIEYYNEAIFSFKTDSLKTVQRLVGCLE